MEEYKFKGKTIAEWEEEVKNADGLDKDGHPNWWKAQAELENAVAYTQLMEEADAGLRKEQKVQK